MRGSLAKLFTRHQHELILNKHSDDKDAAAAYTEVAGGKVVSRQVVRYWRTIVLVNQGNQPKADAALRDGGRKIRTPSPEDDIGQVPDLSRTYQCVLHIPDQHAPYQHPDAVRFLTAVRDAFPIDIVVNAGDELDYHALSFHDADPNLDSAGTELEKAKVFMRDLEGLFPTQLICSSNHGSLVYRKAKHHGIPVQMIRSYREVIFPNGGGAGWSWADEWMVNTPLGPVMFKHSSNNILADAAHNRCNILVGHSHGLFSTEYCASADFLYWGAYGGCLIDNKAMAFAYGKHTSKKPIIGCTLVLEGRPVQIPMVLDINGRWRGFL